MHTMDSKGGTRSTLISLIFTVIITLTTGAMNDYHHSDKMLLSDVKALTLREGHMTNARRSPAVPQLKCVGGAAQYKFTPKVVQCLNMGSDGYDIQWECKTDMDNAYRFGSVEVSCEGYDYPNDVFVLKGSCGLEYTLEFTEEGMQREREKGNSGYQYSSNKQNKSEGGVSGLFVFGAVLVAIYVIYKTCLAPNTDSTPGAQPQQPPPYGFRPEFSQPPQGPPPPYDNSWGAQDDADCSRNHFSQHQQHRHRNMGMGSGSSSGTGGGGFWTGAATGGLLGYMFGSRNGGGSTHTPHSYRSESPSWGQGSNTGFFSSNSSSSSSSGDRGSSGTRTASGFGGTSRR